MNLEQIKSLLKTGENIGVEFKRCGNGIESDTYETVCSFANRFGGDIFCGVLDDGSIQGLNENSLQSTIKNLNLITFSYKPTYSPTLILVALVGLF